MPKFYTVSGKKRNILFQIRGEWKYLYRNIDKNGFTLDILLRKKRDPKSAYAFLKRLHENYGSPRLL